MLKNTHSLSICGWLLEGKKKKKKSEGEDKVENDAKQKKNRWKQKRVQDLSIENEYKKGKYKMNTTLIQIK